MFVTRSHRALTNFYRVHSEARESRLGHRQVFRRMTDYDCGILGDQVIHAALPSCLGTVASNPGSDLARLLGGPSTATTWVVHHLGGYSGNISLSTVPHNWPQPLPGVAAGQ